MAANRKLQSEIDRTLKKVQEGVEIFDEIWEKVYSAQNQNQKEKFESELKSQIKKLQRYRDDIKTWITNSDIKDKRPLTDARKLIETEMERFKVCEKEFKTKAFSKEGLATAPKEDPKEKERNKIRKWIAEKLEQLSSQIDAYEVEIEQCAAQSKKKKDNSSSRWEELVERCRFHERQLEIVLRLIDNETLSGEDVEPIMEQLDYLLEQMVDGNLEEVESIDDESIYEELGLEELQAAPKEEEPHDPPPDKPSKEDKKKGKHDEKDEEKDRKSTRKDKASAVVDTVMLPSINAAAMKAPPPKPTKDAAKATAKSPATPVPPAPAATSRAKASAQVPLTTAQPARGAARVAVPPAAPPTAPPVAPVGEGLFARAAMVTPAQAAERRGIKEDPNPTGKAPACGLPPPHHASMGGGHASSQPTGLPPPPARSSVLQGGMPPGVLPAVRELPPPLGALDGSSSVTPADSLDASHPGGGGNSAHLQPGKPEGLFGKGHHSLSAVCDDAEGGAGGAAPRLPSALPSASGPPPEGGGIPADDEPYDERQLELSGLGGGGSEGGTSVEEMSHALQMLNLSLLNMPEPSDSERPKAYVPRNPYPTPSSFPQTPAPVFDSPAIFEKFDVDTLFFIFYYQQGTYQQYLAARELKKQSWRYHKKYLTWFQRHEEPKVTAEEYEQGTYVYFDYETGWCQRIKSEFTFEYGFLEDELQV